MHQGDFQAEQLTDLCRIQALLVELQDEFVITLLAACCFSFSFAFNPTFGKAYGFALSKTYGFALSNTYGLGFSFSLSKLGEVLVLYYALIYGKAVVPFFFLPAHLEQVETFGSLVEARGAEALLYLTGFQGIEPFV